MGMGRRRSARCGRPPLRSPGRPSVAARSERRLFWTLISTGLSNAAAAIKAGVSQPVGTRWFQEAGGMPPAMFRPAAKPLSGRYLSMAERKEIALLLVQDHSFQEIGRRLGRSASTISREVRRNATTRGWSGISCDRRPVACQAVCPSAEGDEACRERRLAFLCGRQARRRCAHQLRQPGSQVHRIMERGVGMDRDRIDDGRRHGVQNKSPDA